MLAVMGPMVLKTATVILIQSLYLFGAVISVCNKDMCYLPNGLSFEHKYIKLKTHGAATPTRNTLIYVQYMYGGHTL